MVGKKHSSEPSVGQSTSFRGPFPCLELGAEREKALGSAGHMMSEHPSQGKGPGNEVVSQSVSQSVSRCVVNYFLVVNPQTRVYFARVVTFALLSTVNKIAAKEMS